MRIVLDTNVVFGNWLLKGPNFQILRNYLADSQSTLVIPKIVIEEALFNYRRNLEDGLRNLEKAARRLKSLLGKDARVETAVIDVQRASEEYESKLLERLQELKATIVEYEDVPIGRIADRAVTHRKPFSEAEDKGFKDTLIWETILRHLASSEELTVLISNNSKDFGDEENGLLQDLRRDLSAAGLSESCVQLVSSIKSFNGKHAKPKLEVLEDAHAELQSTGRFDWFRISEFFTGQREEIIEKVQEFPDQLVRDEDKETPTVVWLEDPETVVVLEVRRMDDRRVFVSCELTCGASMDFFVLKSNLWSPKPFKSEFLDRDWNRHYSLASERTTLDIVLSITIDLLAKKVDSYEVEDVTRPDECPYCGGRISDAAEECPHCGESFF